MDGSRNKAEIIKTVRSDSRSFSIASMIDIFTWRTYIMMKIGRVNSDHLQFKKRKVE